MDVICNNIANVKKTVAAAHPLQLENSQDGKDVLTIFL